MGVCLISLIILILGSIAFELPFSTLRDFIKDERILFILEYFAYLGVLLMVLIIINKNNYMLKKLILKNNKFILGLSTGFLLNCICVFAAYLNKSVTLSYFEINIPLLLIAFLCVAIQSCSEEFLCRLFIYQKLKKSYNSPLIWMCISSSFFGLIHLFNPGLTIYAITNVILFGVLMSTMIYYFDNIWLVCGLHTAWNFTQSFIFGFPNSGVESKLSIFKLVSSNNSFYFDSAFGIEGSLFVTLILIISIIIVYIVGTKKNQIE